MANPHRFRWLRKHPTLIIGVLLLVSVAAISICEIGRAHV